MRGVFGTLAAASETKSAAILDMLPWLFGAESRSGAVVNWKTALEVTTVLACARVIAEGIAQVPLKLYRQRPTGGADPAIDHALYRLLYRKPNSWQTSFEFRETMGLHLVLTNNFYAYKSIVGGRLFELIPMEPSKVSVTRRNDLSLTYTYTGEDGRQRTFEASEVWHVRGPSWNSWMGMEAVKLAREAIGLAIELEAAHARLHKNGVQPSGAWTVEGNLTDVQQQQLVKWLKQSAGGDNRGAPLVLDRAAKWVSQQMSGVDAQHLETRRHQIEEICRGLRVLPIMVGSADKTATYASAEAMFAAHDLYTMDPWWERIEQSIDVNLLDQEAEPDVCARFQRSALRRASLKDQADYFAKALGAGGSPAWMAQDEVRADVDLNPMGGEAAKLREPTNVGAKAPATSEPGSDPANPKEDA